MEFAFCCIPFFLILFCIIDFAQLFYYEGALQNALREAARFATAGRVIQATNSSGAPEYETNSAGIPVPKAINDADGREASRYACIRYWFMTNCVLKNLPLTNIVVTSTPVLPGQEPLVSTNSTGRLTLMASTTNGTATNAVIGPGGANDYVQITATYPISTITPLVSAFFPCRVSTIVKNEPALLNFQHTNMYGTNASDP